MGVSTGLVILMMSATGVILTYERQMLAFADRDLRVSPPVAGAARLGTEDLLRSVHDQDPEFAVSSITYPADVTAPVTFGAGRAGSRNVDPYTGKILPVAAGGLSAFFATIRAWHRWFDADDEHRETARAITGASNLAFLFLILTGMYLWLPPAYRWLTFRTRLFFNSRAESTKARDYNWHHVFGIWIAIPLALVVASALVFSYDWANELVYRAAGEEPPAPMAAPPRSPAEQSSWQTADTERQMSFDALADIAAAHVDGWKKLTLQLPANDSTASTIRFTIDRGNGGQPQLKQDLVLDATNGAIVEDLPFSSVSPGRKARTILRFLHTGEVLGIAGQTVAGIVSLISLLMIWTGLALAWRRLIQPLFRKKAGAT
jgi:uncharacterized iron-regulated membrane protein